MIRERQLEQALAVRGLNGFFEHVISVHPLAGLFEQGDNRYGKPVVHEVDRGHVFVEGRVGISRLLSLLPPLNLALAQLQLLLMLRRLACESGVQVIRIGDPYFLGIFGLLLARLLRVPLAIRACFDYDLLHIVSGKAVFPRLFRFRWIEKRIERFVFPRCDLVAGANKNNLDYAIAQGANPAVGAVFRYGNLVHPDHFSEPATRGSIEHERAVLGLSGRFLMTVCRLEPMKQPEQTLLVLQKLRSLGYEGLQLLLVGDGSMRTALVEMAREYGVHEQVIFAGNRPQAWIARMLPHASVVLSPHMGRALTEACLAAAPVVAYDYDWQGEIVIDGETGNLVPNGDWQGMAAASGKLLTNRELAMDLGRAARKLAVEMMDPEQLTRREIDAYKTLFQRHKGEAHE